ncbi:MAG: hypothetical protein ACE5IL_02990 [Myxococcota bacterium]
MTLAQSTQTLPLRQRAGLRGSARRTLVWGVLAALLSLQGLVTVHPVGHIAADSPHPCALCAAAHAAPVPQALPETPGAALVAVALERSLRVRYVAALVPARSARAPPSAG